MNPFVDEIVEKPAAAAALDKTTVRELLSVPPREEMGDYALPCFTLAKQLRKNPAAIAAELAGKIATGEQIERVEAAGPYVNFSLKRPRFIAYVLRQLAEKGENYGSLNQGEGKTLTIDSVSYTHLTLPTSDLV